MNVGKSDSSLSFYDAGGKTRQNPESTWSAAQKEAADRLYPGFIPDPANALDIHGKPVFDATFSHKYQVTEKEMSDLERISFKQYQLFKTTLKIDRRDSIYEAFASTDYTNGSAAHNWLGAPFPIIEPRPTITDLVYTVRWYERLGAIVTSMTFYAYIRAKPHVRYSGALIGPQRAMMFWCYGMLEGGLCFRAMNRLGGKVENDVECERFGVMESKARLEEKAKYWERYRKYKEEWMKRYDYYVFGMRPGERYTLFSPCHYPPAAVVFNKRTDFPMRKNPFILSDQPLTTAQKQQAIEHLRAKEGTPHPAEFGRPEMKYHGPLGWQQNTADYARGIKRGQATGGIMT